MLIQVLVLLHLAVIGTTSELTTFEGSLKCTLIFPGAILEEYTQYSVVTGEGYIAEYTAEKCAIVSQETVNVNEDKVKECLKSNLKNDCNDFPSSVIVFPDSTLYYCRSNYLDPKSFKVEKKSSKSYDVQQKSPRNVVSEFILEEYLAIFTSQEFLYTVFKGNIELASTFMFYITKSCKNEKSTGTSLYTYTVAKLECKPASYNEIELEDVLAVEFDNSTDTLYAVFVSKPVDLSGSILCAYNIKDVNTAFDKSTYTVYDIQGKPIEEVQDPMNCSKEYYKQMNYQASDPIVATSVALIYPVKFTSIFIHDIGNSKYLYATNGVQIHIFMKNDSSFTKIQELRFSQEVSKIQAKDESIFYTSKNALLIGDITFCNEFAGNPAKCIRSKNPLCGFSVSQHQCIPMHKCNDCKQDLVNGDFSAVFPNGYSYTREGDECIGDIFIDTSYVFFPNGSYVVTKQDRRCNTVTEANTNIRLSGREKGLVVGLVSFAIIAILAILVLLKRTYPVFPQCENACSSKSNGSDKKVIYNSDQGISNLALQTSEDPNAAPPVIINPSYTENHNDDNVIKRRHSETPTSQNPAFKPVANKAFSFPVNNNTQPERNASPSDQILSNI